jgi:methylglutaconyl-CoA hydratase
VFAVPEAKFGYTEVKLGFMPAIVMVFLLRKIGESKARELLLTGELISAARAKEAGIINFVVEKSAISDEVNAFAEKISLQTSPESISRTKHMMAQHRHMSLDDALEYACHENASIRASADFMKGVTSFLNKEPLHW